MLTVQGRAYWRTHPVEALALHVLEAVRDDYWRAQDLAMRQRLRCFNEKHFRDRRDSSPWRSARFHIWRLCHLQCLGDGHIVLQRENRVLGPSRNRLRQRRTLKMLSNGLHAWCRCRFSALLNSGSALTQRATRKVGNGVSLCERPGFGGLSGLRMREREAGGDVSTFITRRGGAMC